MPTYTYKCPEGHEFEVLRSMKENVSVGVCPECHRDAAQVFRNMPAVDTYWKGSHKDEYPVPMTTRTDW